jgi:hypothetical protein
MAIEISWSSILEPSHTSRERLARQKKAKMVSCAASPRLQKLKNYGSEENRSLGITAISISSPRSDLRKGKICRKNCTTNQACRVAPFGLEKRKSSPTYFWDQKVVRIRFLRLPCWVSSRQAYHGRANRAVSEKTQGIGKNDIGDVAYSKIVFVYAFEVSLFFPSSLLPSEISTSCSRSTNSYIKSSIFLAWIELRTCSPSCYLPTRFPAVGDITVQSELLLFWD